MLNIALLRGDPSYEVISIFLPRTHLNSPRNNMRQRINTAASNTLNVLDIKELFQYAHIVRSRFASKLSELTWEEVCKNREASFYSMKNILLHMIDNEDWMINWVIKGKQDQYVRKSWDDYTSMEQVLKHMSEVETKTYEYFNSLNSEELNRKVTLKIREREFILTVEECLLQ